MIQYYCYFFLHRQYAALGRPHTGCRINSNAITGPSGVSESAPGWGLAHGQIGKRVPDERASIPSLDWRTYQGRWTVGAKLIRLQYLSRRQRVSNIYSSIDATLSQYTWHMWLLHSELRNKMFIIARSTQAWYIRKKLTNPPQTP